MLKSCFRAFIAVLSLCSVSGAVQSRNRASAEKAKPNTEDAGPVTVTRTATYRVPISSDTTGIFAFLCTTEKLEQWLPDQAIFEAQLGGKYHFRFRGSDDVWSGLVTEFIRGNALGLTWKPPGDAYETNLRFKLLPQSGGVTMLEASQSGFASDEDLDEAVKFWTFYLQNLKTVIEQGLDMRAEHERKEKQKELPHHRKAAH
jgi:uncharacterized protein YndB with AHSA1/START domain